MRDRRRLCGQRPQRGWWNHGLDQTGRHIIDQPRDLESGRQIGVGLGIISTTSWACRLELERGALVQIFPDWETAALPVHAYYPMGRAIRIAARAFVEFLSADLVRDPPT